MEKPSLRDEFNIGSGNCSDKSRTLQSKSIVAQDGMDVKQSYAIVHDEKKRLLW